MFLSNAFARFMFKMLTSMLHFYIILLCSEDVIYNFTKAERLAFVMIYSYKELINAGMNRYQIEKKVSNGILYKIKK